MGRKLEEREALITQLQRSKSSFSQKAEELKKQLEEESKVSALSQSSAGSDARVPTMTEQIVRKRQITRIGFHQYSYVPSSLIISKY